MNVRIGEGGNHAHAVQVVPGCVAVHFRNRIAEMDDFPLVFNQDTVDLILILA